MEPSVFEEVAVILPSLVPDELGELHQQARRWGIKVWFGSVKPPRDHYEAQVLGADADDNATVFAIEVGFHAEHPDEKENDALLARLLVHERAWRKVVGAEPVCGPFLGRASHWRRVSETWPDPDLGDGQLAFELAARLTDYVTALQPILVRRG